MYSNLQRILCRSKDSEENTKITTALKMTATAQTIEEKEKQQSPIILQP